MQLCHNSTASLEGCQCLMAADENPERLYESSGIFTWNSLRRELQQTMLAGQTHMTPSDVGSSRRLSVYPSMLLVMAVALSAIIFDGQSAPTLDLPLLMAASLVDLAVIAAAVWGVKRGAFLLPPIVSLLATLAVVIWSVKSGNTHHYFWFFPLLVAVAGLLPTSVGLLVGLTLIFSLLIVQGLGSSYWPMSTNVVLLITLIAALGIMRLMSQQSEELADLALTDPLTGAYNRRYLAPQTQKNLADYRRYARLSSLLLLDIDHFKAINDDYGHATGDRVLQGVVDQISDRIRGADMLFRLGGEEFVILLSEVASQTAAKVADELRETIKAIDLLPDRQVTVSIGVCDVSRVSDPDDWLEQVDSAMYRAKKLGRDRVEIIESLIPDGADEQTDLTVWR